VVREASSLAQALTKLKLMMRLELGLWPQPEQEQAATHGYLAPQPAVLRTPAWRMRWQISRGFSSVQALTLCPGV